MQTSNYIDAATRTFATLWNDMDRKQRQLHRQTFRNLLECNFSSHRANELGEILGNMIQNGGIFQETKEDSVGWRNGNYTPNYSDWAAGDNSKTIHYDPMGCWFDNETRLFNVLEWNKVKGVTVRQYRIMPFLRKLFKAFVFSGKGRPEINPDDFQPFIDVLWPDYSKMELQIWDTPSEMYDHTNIDSCMVGQTYVKFYDTAPCKGLVVLLGEKLVTRCILWTLDDGRRIIGRIYDSTGAGKNLILKWCKDNHVMTEWETNDSKLTVTVPISEHGVPYQDNFWYGCRKGDNLHMFYSEDLARVFRRKNTVYGDRIWDLCHTQGNDKALYHPTVKCVDGSYALLCDVITQEGLHYNTQTLKDVNPHNFSRLDSRAYAFHPTQADRVVTVGELDLVNGDIVVRSECITLPDGQVAHPTQIMREVGLSNGQPYLTGRQVVSLNGGDRILYGYCYSYALRRFSQSEGLEDGEWTRLFSRAEEHHNVCRCF